MEDTMTCEQCGGTMKKMDENTMKCESCGAVKKVSSEK